MSDNGKSLALHEAFEREKALKAQVERLREDIYSQALTVHGEFACGEPVVEFLPDSYNETPAQSLREIRAEAVEHGFVKGCLMFAPENTTARSVHIAAKEYANQIRSGEP